TSGRNDQHISRPGWNIEIFQHTRIFRVYCNRMQCWQGRKLVRGIWLAWWIGFDRTYLYRPLSRVPLDAAVGGCPVLVEVACCHIGQSQMCGRRVLRCRGEKNLRPSITGWPTCPTDHVIQSIQATLQRLKSSFFDSA